MKSTLCVIAILSLTLNSRASDTLFVAKATIPISKDSALKQMSSWQRNMLHVNIFSNQIVSTDGGTSHLLTGQIPYIYTDSRIQIDSISIDSCQITSSFHTDLSTNLAKYIMPHLQGTVRQASFQPMESAKELSPKSPGLYLGLSTVNFGVGGMYLKHSSFVYRVPTFLVVANGVNDAASVAMMFSDDRSLRIIGYSLFAFYRALTLLEIPALNLHNKFSETGYKYSF